MLPNKQHISNNYELPKDGQELRPTHVGATIKKNTVQHVDFKYYIT
jgi:hypothetical protein